jgi:5'-3' exonuclease
MGIERFFTTISKTGALNGFSKSFIDSIDMNNIDQNENIINGKYLYLDFNSIIHNSSSKLISELNSNQNKNYNKLKLDDIELMIIKEVNLFIIRLLERIDITQLEYIYIGIDGVPTFAKILEQKKRRFIGDFVEKLLENYSLPFNWSKNNISPGTVFMNKITKYLNNIKNITKNKLIKKEDYILDPIDYEFYSKIKNIEISDSYEVGEGEIKIFDLINNLSKPKNDILFYSPDADVILLSMISKNSDKIKILKYDSLTNILSIINIELLKKAIYNYCIERIDETTKKIYSLSNIIKDIVFIFTILGNDFLPKCESIQTNLDFLFLIDIYLINLIDLGHIVSNKFIVNQSFFGFISLIKTHEKRLLFRNAHMNVYQNYSYANQKNFILDFHKIKNFENFRKRFGEPFYNFHNNILFYIDPFKIKDEINKLKNKIKNFHGCLEFYLLDKYQLINILKNSNQLPINDLVNIDLNFENNEYEQLRRIKYQSNIKKHIMNMKDLSPRDVELYLINNKLDKYYHLFNPNNEFFQDILKTRKINETFYYSKYFSNNQPKQIVHSYLQGFKWVFQYYFVRGDKLNIDEYWYYSHHKAPLFDTIYKYYSASAIDTIFKSKKLLITPLQQYLYITPIRMSDLSNPDFYKIIIEFKNNKFVDEKLVNRIKLFIEKHPYYFYNLDEIYYTVKKGNLKKDLFNCSSSVFISKCHYQILDYIVDINKFTQLN